MTYSFLEFRLNGMPICQSRLRSSLRRSGAYRVSWSFTSLVVAVISSNVDIEFIKSIGEPPLGVLGVLSQFASENIVSQPVDNIAIARSG